MARYSLVVLKVPLNVKQTNKQTQKHLSQYTTCIVLAFLTSTPNLLSPRLPTVPLWSNTSENPRDTDERNASPRTRTYTSFTLTILPNRWSPLTHASHCMTTSWPAAATQTTVSKPSRATQGIFTPHALSAATDHTSGLGDDRLRIRWLAYHGARLNVEIKDIKY